LQRNVTIAGAQNADERLIAAKCDYCGGKVRRWATHCSEMRLLWGHGTPAGDSLQRNVTIAGARYAGGWLIAAKCDYRGGKVCRRETHCSEMRLSRGEKTGDCRGLPVCQPRLLDSGSSTVYNKKQLHFDSMTGISTPPPRPQRGKPYGCKLSGDERTNDLPENPTGKIARNLPATIE